MSDVGQEIISSVRRHAAANPNFIYKNDPNGCVYVHDGRPSCLIGWALWELGFIGSDIEAHELNVHAFPNLLVASDAPEALQRIHLDQAEIAWLDHVQVEQDACASWGKAIDEADREVPLS